MKLFSGSNFFANNLAVNTDVPGTGTNYYGFVGCDGFYYIIKEVVSGNVTTYSYYAKLVTGSSYATDWTGRSGLTYSTPDVAFGSLA